MSSTRPVIFISSVTHELHSARDLVAETLLALGYEPKWEDIAPMDQGDLLGILRKWIDDSDAVIQLIGHCYGLPLKEPHAQFGPCSHTQYEAHYARQQGKPIHFLLLDPAHPIDGCGCQPEPQALHDLQAKYRLQVKSYGSLYHPSSSLTQTELLVRRLKDDLDELREAEINRQRSLNRKVAIALCLLAVLVLGIGWLKRDLWQQHKENTQNQAAITNLKDQAVETDQKVEAVIQRYKQMEQALSKLAEAEMHAKQFGEKLSPEQIRQHAYALLENEMGIAAGTLVKELPGFALELYSRADTTLLMRARAAYALNKFEEAEKLFLESEAQDKKSMENAEKVAAELRKKRINALAGAGQSAMAQIHYAKAMEHYSAAAALTSQETDVLQWLDLQNMINYLYYLQGRYPERLAHAQQVWQAAQNAESSEAPAVLVAHMRYAQALGDNGQASTAESEYREVIHDQERVLGAEHRNTLSSRYNLANALFSQSKHAEAEREFLAVWKIKERVQGAEHPETLKSRMSAANAKNGQGKHAEAEQEHRAVLEILERVLGVAHPETLACRHNLAVSLHAQGNSLAAEQEYRAVLKILEQLLGAAHPDTLKSRMSVASALGDQGKHAEAEQEHRAVLKIQEHVLGSAHPDVAMSCYNLASCLAAQQKLPEALAFMQRAEHIDTQILGPDHPNSKGDKAMRERIEAALKEALTQ